MRVGILGGTFDPVHEGHVRVALAALAQGKLDCVLLVPTGTPPHRRAQASAADRLAMVALAVAEHAGLIASDADMLDEPCYAADTVRRVACAYPGAELCYIIGEDKLPDLAQWRDAQALFSMCSFLCYPRGEAQKAPAGARVTRLSEARLAASSGLARTALEALSDAPGLLAPSVAGYIALHELYRAPALPVVKTLLSSARYRHTLGVRDTAVSLAARHGASMQRAALTGALHDVARETPYPELLALAREAGIDDRETLASAALLHAPVAAHLAKTRFGVQDAGALAAIAAHTTGAPDMDKDALCLFVADAVEPLRADYPGLAALRELAKRDLTGAAIMSLELTRDYLGHTGGQFASASQKTLQALYQRRLGND